MNEQDAGVSRRRHGLQAIPVAAPNWKEQVAETYCITCFNYCPLQIVFLSLTYNHGISLDTRGIHVEDLIFHFHDPFCSFILQFQFCHEFFANKRASMNTFNSLTLILIPLFTILFQSCILN